MIASVSELLVTSSVLILALLVLRQLLRGRISRRLQYSLWGLAALRLLLPFSLPAGSSVMNLSSARRVEAVITGQTVRVQAGGTAVPGPAAAGTSAAAASEGVSVLPVLWLAGVLAAAVWFLFVNLRFARQLRAARRPMAADCSLPVYRVSGLSSPCLFGLLRPAVYVPTEVTGDPAMLRHILVHEESHWRQRDHIWALVRAVCLCLYWFDPLVWAAAAASREDCERACDERAVRVLGEPERIAYGHTLVAVVRRMRGPVYPGCTATTMSAGRNSLQRRIALIVSGTRTRIWAAAALAVCAAVLIGCTFTGRKADPQQALDELENSIAFDGTAITFTLPESYTPASDWNILVYGQAAMGTDNMSVHFLEQENADRSWQAGQTYSIALGETTYRSLQMDAYLPGDEDPSLTVDLLAKAGIEPAAALSTYYVTFGSETEDSAFDLRLMLPGGWEVRSRLEEGVYNMPNSPTVSFASLLSPMDIYNGDVLVGTLKYGRYTPYTEEPVPPEDEYKTVYTELRLSSVDIWNPYTAVSRYDQGESGIADVIYKDSAYMEAHPEENMASVPELETKGLLCFNRELEVYIALRFEPDQVPDEDTLNLIAGILQIGPVGTL